MIHIFIDGNDGVGKSTLVDQLKLNNKYRVYDRSILSKLALFPIADLPDELPCAKNICDQITAITEHLTTPMTNREIISRIQLTDTAFLSNDFNVYYFILDADVVTSLARLQHRFETTGRELDAWEQSNVLRYFRLKYLFLGYKYNIPIINTELIKKDSLCKYIIDIIDGKITHPNKFDIVLSDIPTQFDPAILEIEWLRMGNSDIIYADNDKYVIQSEPQRFCVKTYQYNIKQKIVNNLLDALIPTKY